MVLTTGNNNSEIFTLINWESIIAILRLEDEESGVVIDSWVVLIGDMSHVPRPGSISALISHKSHSDYRLWISTPEIDESIHVSDSPDKLFH